MFPLWIFWVWMELTEFWSDWGQAIGTHCQDKVTITTITTTLSNINKCLSLVNLWQWLVDHRKDIDAQQSKILFNLYKEENWSLVARDLDWDSKMGILVFTLVLRKMPVHRPRALGFCWDQSWRSETSPPIARYLLQKALKLWTRVTVLRRQWHPECSRISSHWPWVYIIHFSSKYHSSLLAKGMLMKIWR